MASKKGGTPGELCQPPVRGDAMITVCGDAMSVVDGLWLSGVPLWATAKHGSPSHPVDGRLWVRVAECIVALVLLQGIAGEHGPVVDGMTSRLMSDRWRCRQLAVTRFGA